MIKAIAIVGAPSSTKHPSTTRCPSRTGNRPTSMSNPIVATASTASPTATLPVISVTSQFVAASIERAKLNAKRNGIENAVFHAGAVEDELPRLIASGIRPAAAILDPAFKGLEETVPAMLAFFMMPFAYSIAVGIEAGIVTFVALKLLTGRGRELNGVLVGLAVLFVAARVFGLH